MPLLAPGTVGEMLELGLHAVALSRHAGLWTGDEDRRRHGRRVRRRSTLDGVLDAIPTLAAARAPAPPMLLPPTTLDGRARPADRAARARPRVRARRGPEPRRVRAARARGWRIVAAGHGPPGRARARSPTSGSTRTAATRSASGSSSSAMPWPLDRDELRRLLARRRRPCWSSRTSCRSSRRQVKEALYRTPGAPLVLGREDADGRPLLPPAARSAPTTSPARSPRVLAGRRAARARPRTARDGSSAAARALGARAARPRAPRTSARAARTTPRPAPSPTQLVGVGIGCHSMVALDAGDRRGQLLGMPQMGGEGAQWIGLAPFTDDPHFIQNLGDGTFHHSGSLAIRAAVAAGVDDDLQAALQRRRRDDRRPARRGPPRRPRADQLARAGGRRRDRRHHARARASTAGAARPDRHGAPPRRPARTCSASWPAIDGVTVLIHDDRCATEKRRLRKRGKLPRRRPSGCGSTSASARAAATAARSRPACRCSRWRPSSAARRTIHQASCNQDFSCLKGDCPSFVHGRRRASGAKRAARAGAARGAARARSAACRADVLVRMPGIGGTGVVTVSQILQMAAHLDGLHAAGLEQTGLAQKGGPVISDVRIAAAPIEGQLRASARRGRRAARLRPARRRCAPRRSPSPTRRARSRSSTPPPSPTARDGHRHVRDLAPRRASRCAAVEAVTRAGRDRATSTRRRSPSALFGDHMPANLDAGRRRLPARLPAARRGRDRAAIELNGAASTTNIAAFRWGRAAVVDAEAVRGRARRRRPSPRRRPPRPRASLDGTELAGELRAAARAAGSPSSIAYQGVALRPALPRRRPARGRGRRVPATARSPRPTPAACTS